MEIKSAPVVNTGMLIRRPVADVFEAFVDPEITSKFWFTKGSGRLEAGKPVRWEWEMFGIAVDVRVRTVDADRRIVIDWTDQDPPPTVEWIFTPRGDGEVFVEITNSGFNGNDEALVKQALDSMGGFTLVLAGAKALLEHNIRLNLIADRYPDGH